MDLPTTYAEALLVERAGYLARDQKDRVAQVDAELAKLGVVADDSPPAAEMLVHFDPAVPPLDLAGLDKKELADLAASIGAPVSKRVGADRLRSELWEWISELVAIAARREQLAEELATAADADKPAIETEIRYYDEAQTGS